ncbi:hypothetical protein [uncultured Formosa sp.]|uniref:hypothetical protein n=1 Tax=uncultured Formosa sp. TaxID=255435 RepID=UPI0026305150|nr:hypothetical protein [uncultured Formosa sp.]
MIKIRYKKKKLNMNLIAGVVWSVIAIIKISFTDQSKLSFLTYGWIILAILYLSLYFVQRFTSYMTIENNVISKPIPLPKQIAISDITEIKKFKSGYKLISETKTLAINTEMINEDDLATLHTFLDGIQVKA